MATDHSLRTIVADWETVQDECGDTISADMLPVVVTVSATSREEAFQAAADKLQEYFGPDVEGLYQKGIERDWWFGFNDNDPLLRVSAVFLGCPPLDDENDDTLTVIR